MSITQKQTTSGALPCSPPLPFPRKLLSIPAHATMACCQSLFKLLWLCSHLCAASVASEGGLIPKCSTRAEISCLPLASALSWLSPCGCAWSGIRSFVMELMHGAGGMHVHVQEGNKCGRMCRTVHGCSQSANGVAAPAVAAAGNSCLKYFHEARHRYKAAVGKQLPAYWPRP